MSGIDFNLLINVEEPARVLETLKHIGATNPAQLEGILSMYSTKLVNDPTAGYGIMEMLSQLDPNDVKAISELANVLDLLGKAKQLFDMTVVINDPTLSDLEKANILKEDGYDMLASLLLNATPGVNIIINIPVVGGYIEWGLKEGGKVIGDTVGGAFDRSIDWGMDAIGFKDWLLRHREEINNFISNPAAFQKKPAPDVKINWIKKDVQVENAIGPMCGALVTKASFLKDTVSLKK